MRRALTNTSHAFPSCLMPMLARLLSQIVYMFLGGRTAPRGTARPVGRLGF